MSQSSHSTSREGRARGTWRSSAALGALALAASGSGLLNGFTYDDRSIILQNPRLHHLMYLGRLWWQAYWPASMGAGLYRPITTSAFTLEWVLGRGAPWVFHATNIALYVAVCLAVYALAGLVLRRVYAWVAAALFAVHPVHVEAVANVVGQSELWAALGVISAVVLYVRWRRADLAAPRGAESPRGLALGGWRDPLLITTLVLGACLAKEHAIVAPGLIAAAELWVVGDPRAPRVRWRALRPVALLLTATLLAYVLVRARVLGVWTGDRPNVVFEHLSAAGRGWTMLGIAPEWVRLLFWPSRLVAEYAPLDIGVFEGFSLALLPNALLVIAVVALFIASTRRWPVLAFALAWIGITLLLVSNLAVPTGVVLAERTLFLPSVGAVLLVGAVLARATDRQRLSRGAWPGSVRVAADVALAAVLAAGIWHSAERQRVWRSNEALFSQGVIDAPFSYRAHDVYAGLLFERGDRRGGEREARLALALYPHDAVLYRDLANEYVRGNLCTPAVPLLRRAIAEATIPMDAHVLLADCLLLQGDPAAARDEVLRGVATGDYRPIYHQLMVAIDSARARHAPTGGGGGGGGPGSSEPETRGGRGGEGEGTGGAGRGEAVTVRGRTGREWRAGAVVALIAGVAYANAAANAFTLDDDTVIAKNDLVRHLSTVWRAFAHPYWPENTPAGQYRPLAIISFALDWAASGGSPHWFHAMNVVWHVLACVLVWRLLRDFVPPAGALAGALYFVLQPVHVEAVANTVGRCDVMAAAFVVGALLAHRRGSWAAVPLYAAALASKESGAVFLGLAVANDVLVGATPVRAHRAAAGVGGVGVGGVAGWREAWRAIGRRQRELYAGYVGVALVYVAALAAVFRARPLVDIAPAWMRASLIDRWLTEARVVPEYVRLMLAPFDLKIEYSPQVISIAHGLSGLVLLGLAVTVVAGACLAASWRRAPVVALGLAWFAIAISPVSNIFFASGVVLAERTLYLPSVGATLIVAWLAERALRGLGIRDWGLGTTAPGPASRATDHESNSRRWLRPVFVAAAALLFGAFAVRTWTRTSVWHDDKRLVLTSLISEPESYRTHLRAAIILGYRKDWAGAAHEYAVARTLFPGDANVFEAAAMVADGQNEFALADRLYDSASLVRPGFADAYLKQARLRYRAGDFRGAIQSARSAYLAAPDSVAALDVLTGAAQKLGDFASAEWAFRRGIADHPGDARLHQQFSWMLSAKGDTAGSRREAALAARPDGSQGGSGEMTR